MAADPSLKEPVVVQATRIDATLLPSIFSIPYQLYVIQNGVDFGSVAGKANDAGNGAYDAQVKNDEQDIELANHEQRITAAEGKIVNHEIRITAAESEITSLNGRVSTLESDVDYLQDAVVELETDVSEHETEITDLQYITTRKKSEVVYSGISLTIPTSGANLVGLIKTLIPTSGTLAPFFDTANNKMVVFNENKTVLFKLSIVGTWAGGTTNRSMQLTFSGAVPDTLVVSRNAATATDNILMATFFSVDKGGFLATNGSTMTIQSNGSAFTAISIKIIAEQ